MSVKNGPQRTANRGGIPWIAVIFPVVSALSVCGAASAAASGLPPVGAQGSGSVTEASAQSAWEEVIRWLLDQLVIRMNCGSTPLPDDVPVAMLIITDCYITGSLAPMSSGEKSDYLATIDETMAAIQASPSSVPLLTRVQFTSTLKLMRAEVQLLP